MLYRIIHTWAHVIYLQLELSTQQLKPKNCWSTAGEETCASLSTLAFKLNDHAV